MDTNLIKAEVRQITPAAGFEELAETFGKVQALMARAKEIKAEMEQQMIEYIAANGDVTIGDIRYYIGNPPKTRCVNVGEAINELLASTGGDLDQLGALLVSDPIKHGAAKKVLPENVYARLFRVEHKTTLEQGKPKLQSVNQRFLPQQPRDAARSK